MVVLAVTESVAHPLSEGWADWSPGSVPVTGLAAATVLGRRVALGPAALACAAVFGLGTLLGAPVVDGFWTLGTVGVLLWSAGAGARTVVELVGGLLLAAAVVSSRAVDTPDNLPITVVTVVVATLAGLLVRAIRVGGERAVFARELHDIASHAVGVIALQAAAASVSWRQDPEGAALALDAIGATADTALGELARLHPVDPGHRTLDDLYALVDRIRATGTELTLEVEGEVPDGSLYVVHRIVQESLTNVLRHAPGARARVVVRADADGTTVSVVDDGPGTPGDGRRGYGLVGLAERVGFAGGTLDVGTAPGGTGFRVSARLPAIAPAVTA